VSDDDRATRTEDCRRRDQEDAQRVNTSGAATAHSMRAPR
jgi:hypothetical protein